jgi:ribosomal protein L12E/L44/L45/RPP1/RPP2
MKNSIERKDAYYFSHDSNARNDEKVLSLRMSLGMEGYGIYWSIIEKMRENTDYMCSKAYDLIAFDLRVEEDKIKRVVEDFGLFEISESGKKFYSKSLLNRMAKMNEKSEKARESANARWNKSGKAKEDANAIQTQSDSNAIKEKKEKEKKENKLNSIKGKPTDEDPPENMEFSEKDFIDDWIRCRRVYKRAESALKKLSKEELDNFNMFKQQYTRDQFRQGLTALFQQENIKYNTILTKPTHFLTKVDFYIEAGLGGDRKLFGAKERTKSMYDGIL